jgi:hypothetical protein
MEIKINGREIKYKVNEEGCWIPVDRKPLKSGYYRITHKRKAYRLHRFSYKFLVGFYNENNLICHTCDNKECFNPGHLFEGTHIDNMKDMRTKGRAASGSENGRAKLSEKDVYEIKHLIKFTAFPFKLIAIIYEVSVSLIREIEKERNWTHVAPELSPLVRNKNYLIK